MAQVDVLHELLHAFRRSQVLFTLVDLKVFELLHRRGASTAEAISIELKTHRGATERLLNTAVNLDLVNLENYDRQLYSNSSLAESYLLESGQESLVGIVRHSKYVIYPLFGNLSEAVRTGQAPWGHTFGDSGNDAIFDRSYATPEDKLRFMNAMHSTCSFSSDPLVSAFDLSEYRHMVDIGGSTGHTAVAACRLYKDLSVTILELPSVIPDAQEFVKREEDVCDRIQFVAGDMFNFEEVDVAEFDLVLLSKILHDWEDDEKCKVLLSGVFSRLKPGGGILIGEKLLSDMHKSDSETNTLLQDLNMMVQMDGCERSPSEFRTLLESVGFTEMRVKHTTGNLHAVFAQKPIQ